MITATDVTFQKSSTLAFLLVVVLLGGDTPVNMGCTDIDVLLIHIHAVN
jgi:hypothetical protein